MKTARELLGENLRSLMDQRGLTLEDIAGMATQQGKKLSWATVQRAAAGKRIPREPLLTLLARLLGIPESRLFLETQEGTERYQDIIDALPALDDEALDLVRGMVQRFAIGREKRALSGREKAKKLGEK